VCAGFAPHPCATITLSVPEIVICDVSNFADVLSAAPQSSPPRRTLSLPLQPCVKNGDGDVLRRGAACVIAATSPWREARLRG